MNIYIQTAYLRMLYLPLICSYYDFFEIASLEHQKCRKL